MVRKKKVMALIKPTETVLFEKVPLKLRKMVYRRGKPSAELMRYAIMLCAMANFELLADAYRRDLHYANLEGLEVVDLWKAKMAAKLNDL